MHQITGYNQRLSDWSNLRETARREVHNGPASIMLNMIGYGFISLEVEVAGAIGGGCVAF